MQREKAMALPQTQTDIREDQQALAEAFSVFNNLSEQLTSAYGQLEHQVAELNTELARSREEKVKERAQKEHLADRLSGLLEALPAAVVLVDGRDRIDRFNPAAEQLFPNLSWGRLWSEVLSESVSRAMGHGDWLLSDGQRISVTQRPLADNGQILVMVDVTETRLMEERLERQDRLSAMGEMAAQLAHQIRTPLAASVLYAGQLRKAALNAQQREAFADKLLSGLRHTEQLISDMLAFSRGGNYIAQSMRVCGMLQTAIHAIEPRFKQQAARLDFACLLDDDVLISGNQDALSGAIINLIDNALNHGGEGVCIALTAELQDGALRITLSDNGPGIPADVKKQIFDPFFTTRERGTGLGLAVVQAVVLEHQGSVTAATSDGGGAQFVITLPIAEAAEEIRSLEA